MRQSLRDTIAERLTPEQLAEYDDVVARLIRTNKAMMLPCADAEPCPWCDAEGPHIHVLGTAERPI